MLFQSSVAYVLNEFCLFELILCVFESCQVGLPGLKTVNAGFVAL